MRVAHSRARALPVRFMPRAIRGALGASACLAGLLVAALVEGPCLAADAESTPPAAPGTDVARFQYTALTPSGVHRDTATETGTLGLTFRDFNLAFPVAGLGTDMTWFGGIGTRDLSLDFSGFAPSQGPLHVPQVYAAYAVAGFHRSMSGDRAIVALLATGRFADRLNADVPLATGGLAVLRQRLGPSARWGFGAVAGADFGDPLLTPVIEYAYSDGRWTANLQLPLNGDVRYWIGDRVSVGARWLVQGGAYRVTSEERAVDTARVTAGTLAAVLSLGGRTGPLVELAAGRTLFQRYRALRAGNDVETLNFTAAPMVSFGAAWRF